VVQFLVSGPLRALRNGPLDDQRLSVARPLLGNFRDLRGLAGGCVVVVVPKNLISWRLLAAGADPCSAYRREDPSVS
jgi:hypothetical protein